MELVASLDESQSAFMRHVTHAVNNYHDIAGYFMSGTGMESSISLYQDYSGTSIMYITYFIDDKKTLILSHLVSIDPNQISICIHSGNFKDLYYTAGYWNGQPTGEKIYVEFK